MKKIFILSLIISYSLAVNAQSPVKWSWSATKMKSGIYEIHLTAKIDPGWHVYAQQQPEEAIAVPTSIKFIKNPIISFLGEIKEAGHREHFRDPELGIEAFQYAGEVDFVQQVKLKTNGKTIVRGSISFQACTDEKCLPPATTEFNINLE